MTFQTRPENLSLFWVSVVLFEYITLHSVIWILTYEKEYLLNMNPISGGDYKAILEKNSHSVFCCNTEFDVEGIVKLITVISMHHYALMGLTNGFRIYSKQFTSYYDFITQGACCLWIEYWYQMSLFPHRFVFHQPSGPLISHTTHMYTRSPLGLRCLGTAITYQAVFSCSFKRLPDDRRPHVLQREILIRIIIKRITHCNLLQKHHLLDHS